MMKKLRKRDALRIALCCAALACGAVPAAEPAPGANPTLAWCDITYRGYGAVKLTRQACEAEWIAFDGVRTPQATASVTRFTSTPSETAGPGAWAVSG